MDEKVITFPKKHLRPEILTEEGRRQADRARDYSALHQSENFVQQAVDTMVGTFGLDLDDPKMHKALSFWEQAAQALFYRAQGLDHPFDHLIEKGKVERDEDGNERGFVWTFPRKRDSIAVPIKRSDEPSPVATEVLTTLLLANTASESDTKK
jgi:hypothetical protein